MNMNKKTHGTSKKKIIVGRHIEGISINPLEYILDDNGDAKEFINKKEAVKFLKENGFSKEDIYWFVFEKIDML